MQFDCLDSFQEIVGLTDKDLSCFADAPSGAALSESGYFLTDMDYGFHFPETVWAGHAKDDATLWTLLTDARRQAVHAFLEVLSIEFQKKYNVRGAYIGTIGKNETGSYSPITQGHFGISLRVRNARGAYLKINQIGLALSTTVSPITVSLYRVVDGVATLIDTFTGLESEANRVKLNTITDYSLQLWSDDDCDDFRYWFVIENDTYTASRNRFHCCGNKPSYYQYFDAQGLYAEEPFPDSASYLAHSPGLILGGTVFCNSLKWLCDFNELDSYNLTSVVGRAVQFKATSLLSKIILESANLNRYTLLDREALLIKYKTKNEQFIEYCTWIVDRLPIEATDCFVCKPAAIQRKSILV